jgi:hypothetical protein
MAANDASWLMPLQELMRNNAKTRASHYRLQAIELREMATTAETSKTGRDLLELADRYDALADAVSPD